MEKNRLYFTVELRFDFRGQHHCYQSTLPLPWRIEDSHAFCSVLPRRLAEQQQLNAYAYEYEVMESAPIDVVAVPEALIAHLPPLPLPIHTFLKHYQGLEPTWRLQPLAMQFGLEPSPALFAALTEAYRFGQHE
ncbi:MAG: hypothetical protein JXR44_07600 [Thiotrichales bacterium]|nr:hypothetical protein [Thiotrichales bacterium]